MATKTRVRSRKKAEPKTTSLTEDLKEILTSLDLFRAKHRIVHVQLHSVDTDWVAENDKAPEKAKKCVANACPECTEECETHEDFDDCDCSCTCDSCTCQCGDCSDCDKCNGTGSPISTFREYWDESVGKDDTFKDWSTVMVGMNQADADNLWSASGETVKDTVADIGAEISNELEEQKAYVVSLVEERDVAVAAEAKTREVIERLKTLHTPSEQCAAAVAHEQDEFDATVERFKLLDLS